MKGSIQYIIIGVRDLKRSIGFFRDIIGFPLAMSDESFQYGQFDAGTISFRIVGVSGEQAESFKGQATGIGIGVADLDAAYQELKSRGVEFPLPPTRQPWGGYMARFADPDGNLFYLDQMV